MQNLILLKDKIEKMTKSQHIEILRLLNKHSQIIINENNNGTFVNLTELSVPIIELLEKYVVYVEEQHEHLLVAEQEMQRLNKTFFKGNKEIGNTKLT